MHVFPGERGRAQDRSTSVQFTARSSPSGSKKHDRVCRIKQLRSSEYVGQSAGKCSNIIGETARGKEGNSGDYGLHLNQTLHDARDRVDVVADEDQLILRGSKNDPVIGYIKKTTVSPFS
jgi:hypothetical protein